MPCRQSVNTAKYCASHRNSGVLHVQADQTSRLDRDSPGLERDVPMSWKGTFRMHLCPGLQKVVLVGTEGITCSLKIEYLRYFCKQMCGAPPQSISLTSSRRVYPPKHPPWPFHVSRNLDPPLVIVIMHFQNKSLKKVYWWHFAHCHSRFQSRYINFECTNKRFRKLKGHRDLFNESRSSRINKQCFDGWQYWWSYIFMEYIHTNDAFSINYYKPCILLCYLCL